MKRSVVTILFPFSDLSGSKRRPALIIADWGGSDVILCQITSKSKFDGYEVGLTATDFEEGRLPLDSNARPNKIFTAHKNSILSINGKVSEAKYKEVVEQIGRLIL